jgi:hypothetical protein
MKRSVARNLPDSSRWGIICLTRSRRLRDGARSSFGAHLCRCAIVKVVSLVTSISPLVVASSYDPTRRRIVYRFKYELVSRWARLAAHFA